MVICALFCVKKPKKWRISAVFCGFLFGGAIKLCDFVGAACFLWGVLGVFLAGVLLFCVFFVFQAQFADFGG